MSAFKLIINKKKPALRKLKKKCKLIFLKKNLKSNLN